MCRTLAIVALGAVLALAGQAAAKPAPVPDRVLVRGSEFDLVLSKQRVHPGRVIIQFVNGGEDPHDLRLQRRGEGEESGLGEVGPGEYENLDTRLRKRSTYLLWCSLSGHRESGMEATLRTKKRRLRG
jgi:hypothetical protein